MKQSKLLTVDFRLLFRAALRSSLGSWVLDYEVANLRSGVERSGAE